MKIAIALAFLFAASACGAAPQSGHYSWSFDKDVIQHAELVCDRRGDCQLVSSTYPKPSSDARPMVANDELTRDVKLWVDGANRKSAKEHGFNDNVAAEQVKAVWDIGAGSHVLGCYIDENKGSLWLCELDGMLLDVPGGGKTAWFYAMPDMTSATGYCPGRYCYLPIVRRD